MLQLDCFKNRFQCVDLRKIDLYLRCGRIGEIVCHRLDKYDKFIEVLQTNNTAQVCNKAKILNSIFFSPTSVPLLLVSRRSNSNVPFSSVLSAAITDRTFQFGNFFVFLKNNFVTPGVISFCFKKSDKNVVLLAVHLACDIHTECDGKIASSIVIQEFTLISHAAKQ